MSWKLKQIFLPDLNLVDEYLNYENQLQPRMRLADPELRLLFEQHEVAIMGIVVREITACLTDESACNDEEDMFLRRSEMTGEWYVGEIELSKKRKEFGVTFSRVLQDVIPNPVRGCLRTTIWVQRFGSHTTSNSRLFYLMKGLTALRFELFPPDLSCDTCYYEKTLLWPDEWL